MTGNEEEPIEVDANGVLMGMAGACLDEQGQLVGQDGQRMRTRLYKCPREHCTKVYKNANGLKYHREKGQCEVDFNPHAPLPAPGTPIRVTHRPYWCRVPACGKRYKNLNGLKYHAKTSHPHVDFKQLKGHMALS
ncbi:hypothetical protein HDV00_009274 [Rhizophlyctis rosea]|nr:hypothetical protein HDV00_009274 [Rhizophlyctis rosea]